MNLLYNISAILFQLISFITHFQTVVHDFAIRLFGTSFLFVLELLGGVILLLLLSAAVSHFFKLDKFYEESVFTENQNQD
jgi:hypothetical protein